MMQMVIFMNLWEVIDLIVGGSEISTETSNIGIRIPKILKMRVVWAKLY